MDLLLTMDIFDINDIKFPPELYLHYNSYRQKQPSWKTWHDLSNYEIWLNLVFCILSSNVDTDLARSVLNSLSKKNLLLIDWLVTEKKAYKILASELEKPLYLPRRKNGSLRKYRFPHVRAKNIVNAARKIYEKNIDFKRYFQKDGNEKRQRLFLVENIPGVGYKQATHFLRNIGFSDSLAIIDTHILAFLNAIHATNDISQKTLSPKIYEEYEELFLKLSKNLNLEPALLDYAIWDYMKGRLVK